MLPLFAYETSWTLYLAKKILEYLPMLCILVTTSKSIMVHVPPCNVACQSHYFESKYGGGGGRFVIYFGVAAEAGSLPLIHFVQLESP